jgi:hypothetical protein
VMLRELHGPLGDARYQEYARHINDSGSRLLQYAEEALALMHAMIGRMGCQAGIGPEMGAAQGAPAAARQRPERQDLSAGGAPWPAARARRAGLSRAAAAVRASA